MKMFGSVAILLGISVGSHAYVLDGSCDPYKAMVIKGMQSAFDMSSAASFLLGTIPQQSTGARWEAEKDLISYLFSQILTDGAMNPYTTNWEKVKQNFDDIQSLYKTNADQPDTTPANNAYVNLDTNKLVVYCDYQRFNNWENKNCAGETKKGFVCDPYLKISYPMGDIYTGCKNSDTVLGNMGTVVQAWTSDFSANDRASMIQLCPGLLTKETKAYSQALTDQSKKPSLARAWGGLKKGLTQAGDFLDDPLRTPMDVKYSFDGTLLHEMSHALPGRGVVEAGGKSGSYGWKNCVKLSADGAMTNADSYAYFGLGARMISPNIGGVTAQRPMQDGSIQVLPVPAPATGGSKKKRDYSSLHVLKPRYVSPNITLTIDNSTVVLKASNTAGFVVSAPSISPVTISPGREYTIGSDTIILQGSALVEDASTILLPVASASTTSTDSSQQASSSPITGPSKVTTSTRSQNSSISLSAGTSSSSSSSSRSSIGSSTSLITGPGSPSNSSAGLSVTSKLGSSVSTSSSLSQLSASISSTSGTSSPSITASATTTAFETITSGSSTNLVPITVINVSKSGTTSPVTYVSTFTSSGDIKPTGVWICTGPLCNTPSGGGGGGGGGGGCIIPVFCPSSDDSSSSWGLCCGWNPPSPPGGGPPPPGGPQPGPPPSKNDPTGSQEQNSASKTSGSGSSSQSSTSSSSSCSSVTTSACDTSFSIFTPTGATTASTSTVTLSCSTVAACSASLTGSSTTASGDDVVASGTPIGDIFYEWGASTADWFDVQQAFLSAADADTTDPYITWYSNSTTSGSSSPTSSVSPPSASPSTTALSKTSQSLVISTTFLTTTSSRSTPSSSTSSSLPSLPTLSKQCYTSSLVNCEYIFSPATVCPSTTALLPASCTAKPTSTSTTPTSTAPTFTATPSTTLGDLTCYGNGVNPVVGPNYAFPDNLGQTSINYLCGSDGPKYESNPKYSDGWPNSPGYAGDWFFFDGTTEAFCGSSPIDETDNGWWSSQAKCNGGDKSQVKIWVDVAFSTDQTGCSPEKTWDIPKDQSCKDIYNTILGCKSPILKSDATYGGALKQKTPNGCVDWRIWSTNGDNMGPS